MKALGEEMPWVVLMLKCFSGPENFQSQLLREAKSLSFRLIFEQACRLASLLILSSLAPIASIAQCTLSFQGVSQGNPPGTFAATTTATITASCPGAGSVGVSTGDDPPGSSGGNTVSAPGATLVTNRTYDPTPQVYRLVANGDEPHAAYISFSSSPLAASAVFSGKPATVMGPLASDVAANISASCDSVVPPSGIPNTAAFYNISCSLEKGTVALPANPNRQSTSPSPGQTVSVVVRTSGVASGFASVHSAKAKALLASLPLTALLFFGLSFRRQSHRLRQVATAGIGISMALCITSCGGGFTSAAPQAVTPSGVYLVRVITDANPRPVGFIQNTLIVPLYVGLAQ